MLTPACAPAQKTRPVPFKAKRLPTLSLGGASFASPSGTDVESPQAPGAATQRGPALADGAAAGFPTSPSPPLVSLGHVVSRVGGAWCSADARPRALPRCKLGARYGGAEAGSGCVLCEQRRPPLSLQNLRF